MAVQGGPIQLVHVVTADDLVENGGGWRVGRQAVRVHAFSTEQRAVKGGPALPVYVVTDGDVAPGRFVVQSGAAMPVGDVAVLGGSERPVAGRTAIPVYVVGGSL